MDVTSWRSVKARSPAHSCATVHERHCAGWSFKRNSPNLNAYAERAIQSLKHECLNHFILLGERHLNHLIHEYVEFYHNCRPHSACGNLPPCRDGPTRKIDIRIADWKSRTLQCESRLGGLLKSYAWRVAA